MLYFIRKFGTNFVREGVGFCCLQLHFFEQMTFLEQKNIEQMTFFVQKNIEQMTFKPIYMLPFVLEELV